MDGYKKPNYDTVSARRGKKGEGERRERRVDRENLTT
jgi:hypothetical protein